MPQMEVVSIGERRASVAEQAREEGYREGHIVGYHKGTNEVREEHLKRREQKHLDRTRVHWRRCLFGLTAILLMAVMLGSNAFEPLHEKLKYVLGGFALFTAQHFFKWAWHKARHFELTFKED